MLPQVAVIVTRLFPAIDGVGDYGLSLALHLYHQHDFKCSFIVGDPNWDGDDDLEGLDVVKVRTRTVHDLLKLLERAPSNVLLHYVGHGYAKRGCPTWLVEALEQWRREKADRFLTIMFHETYAEGKLWNSTFFTSPFQQYLFKRLVCLSDRCITNRRKNAECIVAFSNGKHSYVPVVPIFSNVGEPKEHLPLALRKKTLIIFGGPYYRSLVYQNSLAALESVCKDLEIAEIIDIGPPLKFDIPSINDIPVSILGVRSGAEVSSLLLDAIAGFLDYPPDYLCRSTIFAAYCAHKVLPVLGLSFKDRQCEDILEVGKQFYLPNLSNNGENKIDLVMAQTIADNAHNWYQPHNLSVHATTFLAEFSN